MRGGGKIDTGTGGRLGGRLAVTFGLVCLLPLTALHSYELFHSVAEVLFTVVAFAVLIMALTLRSFLDDDFPVFLGIALGGVSLLHILHLLDFPGVDMVTTSYDPPTQLWMAARLITAVSFVISPFILGRRIPARVVGAVYVTVDVLVILSIYWWDVFPSALSPETGLTPFKRVGEFVVCVLFALAIVLLWRRREQLPEGTLQFVIGGLLASIAAELFFMLYKGPHTWPNMIGHVFVTLSAALVYLGIIQDGLARPHAVSVRSLQEAQRMHERLERGLLPRLSLDRPDLVMVSEYRPGEKRLELGGDFIDVIDRGAGGVAVICGDVSGHGPNPAALGAMLRVSWESLVLAGAGPKEIVESLRQVIKRERRSADTFATVCFAWIDPAESVLTVVNMGHPQPLLIAESVSEVQARPMPPLGSIDLPLDEPLRVMLPPDWTLLFYTDGLVEGRGAPGSSERFGEERLMRQVEMAGGRLTQEGLLARLMASIEAASGEPFVDDVTAVAISGGDGVVTRSWPIETA